MTDRCGYQEDVLAYEDGLTGTTRRFEFSREEIVVAFVPGLPADDVRELAARAGAEVAGPVNTDRDFMSYTVFQVPPDRFDEAVEQLCSDDRVVGLRPAMTDEEGGTRYFVPRELTVQFLPGVDRSEALDQIGAFGGAVLEDGELEGTPGFFTISLGAGQTLFQELQRWQAAGAVRFTAPTEFGFDEADYDASRNPEFAAQWGPRVISASHAWDIEQGNPSVVVAVVDSGVDASHPDLVGNILPRGNEDWSFVLMPASQTDVDPIDLSGHGTQVAGVVGAVDNHQGIIGIAPGCLVMPLRVNTASGTYPRRANAINTVTNHARAHPGRRYVINCSWHTRGPDPSILNAIRTAVSHGLVVVFSAGNDGEPSSRFPGRHEEVIAVAATDRADRKEPNSNFGEGVDLCAPGAAIRTTTKGGAHADATGTSFAAPHVAGVAALILSHNPTLTVAAVRAIIESTCDDIDAQNPPQLRTKLGKGRLNAHQALLNTPPPSP